MWLVEGGWSHLLPGNWFGAAGRQLPALGLAVAEFSELLAGVPTTAAAAAATAAEAKLRIHGVQLQ